MKKIQGYVSTGYVGCDGEFEFEVEEDTPEDKIHEIALDCLFETIEWSWWEVKDEEKEC